MTIRKSTYHYANRTIFQKGLNTIKDYLSNPRYLLPAKVDQGQCLDVYVSEIIECGLFWCNIQDKAHLDTLNTIQLIMNGPWESSTSSRHEKKYALKALISHSIQVDTLCVTKYLDQSTGETQLYRANIINVNKSRGFCEVIFVDFGNKEKKLFSELYEMNNELKQYPFQAFKCKLANIKICPFKNPTGKCQRTFYPKLKASDLMNLFCLKRYMVSGSY